jgi:hypothetical protein
MRVPRHGWSLILIGLMVVGYVYRIRAQGTPQASQRQAAAPAASVAEAASESRAHEALSPSEVKEVNETTPDQDEPAVAAAVNGVSIFTAELNQRTNYLLERCPLPPDKPPTSQEQQRRFATTRWGLLREMIEDLLWNQAAREAEQDGTVTVPARHVTVVLAALTRRHPTEEAFQRAYPHYLYTREEFIKDEIRRSRLQKNLTKGLTVTEAEERSYYRTHREEFTEFGRLLSLEEAQQRQWVTRSVQRAKVRATMAQFLTQRRQQGSVVIFLNQIGQ